MRPDRRVRKAIFNGGIADGNSAGSDSLSDLKVYLFNSVYKDVSIREFTLSLLSKRSSIQIRSDRIRALRAVV